MLWFLLFALRVPLGLDSHIPAPPDNPLRDDSIRLGRALFFDKRLSRDQSLSCATCHDPARAFTDALPRARGINGQIGPRRSPRILNRAWGRSFFWDGRAATLEEQVVQPIANPLEMDLPVEAAADRVHLDVPTLRRALATYVRTILAGDSPYDRYLAGDPASLTPVQKRGLHLFRGKAGCIGCHLGPNLTDEDLHDTGAGRSNDPGRAGAFKTPSLRQVAEAAPYFHDGSAATLEEVIDHYNSGGPAGRASLDNEMRPLHLSAAEKQDLAAFLRSFSGVIREGL
ncbi:MAG TPA: cytochrome c peroxidase [Bryobacteraceae bacterium]|nr:cytochrome c peroxidase [Bryobacteraceae bacterium]